MAKKKLNPLSDAPQNLTDLTLDFMATYISKLGKKEDKDWYISEVKKLWGTKYNKIAKKDVECVTDIPALRKLFAERFFPNLITRKASGKKQTYLEMLEDMFK